jgi:hypothetical protein
MCCFNISLFNAVKKVDSDFEDDSDGENHVPPKRLKRSASEDDDSDYEAE